MIEPSDVVWYASYGSNLSWSRLRCYLEGGRAPGAGRSNRGAGDPSAPTAQRMAPVPYRLRFARQSRVWHGGIAFLEPEPVVEHATWVRLWQIGRGQLDDLHGQENGRGWYPDLIGLGTIDGVEVWSITDRRIRSVEPNRPAGPYLRLIAEGLSESVGLDTGQVADYLLGLCRMAEWFGREELVQVLSDRTGDGDQPARRSRQSARYDGYSRSGTT